MRGMMRSAPQRTFKTCLLPLLFGGAITGIDAASAQEAVYLIRHAEKAEGEDPALLPEGRDRAAAWAGMLQRAEIDVVLTSDAVRTRETGGIIARALDIPTEALAASDVTGLVDLMTFDHEEDRVLVVGHAETLPAILEGLGVGAGIEIDQDDFGNLFVVFRPGTENAGFLWLTTP